MTLAIFDLDNTLIAGDSDHLWGRYLCDRGLVDTSDFAERNEQFYRAYQAGQLDIQAYLRFALAPLAGRDPRQLAAWHADFMATVIAPLTLPAAQALIERHRGLGHRLLVITATNAFITGPIVAALGIADLLACEAERVNGFYTGEPVGTPSFGQGKVTRLAAWRQAQGESLDGAWFYSDSHNDLPLLSQVDNPVAVDPDPALRAHAEQVGWPVISLR
ncbi:MAG: HAD family hydrolase [Parahaliea sp.]